MKMNVTTCITLDTRRKLNNCLLPVKIRVTFNRSSRYYSTGYALSPGDFEKVMGKAPRGDFKTIRKALIDREENARKLIEDIDVFSFEKFNQFFLNRKIKSDDIFCLLESKIKKLNDQERIKTARSNQNTVTTLKWFSKKSKMPIKRITEKFLEDYEKWMINRGRSITTVGIYARNIRAVFNDAIADGIVKHEYYPFGRKKYQIPTGRSIKKALRKNDVLKILNYQAKNEIEAYSRDIWIFSYLANGMNITDIANLTFDNVTDDFLVFLRSKTSRSTRSKPIQIKVYISDQMRDIIYRWGNQRSYLFPILNDAMTTKQKIDKVELVIRSINHHIGKIAKSVGIEKKVTTLTARHTFGTVLKRSDASIEYISESLGHSNIITTKHYLDSFEDDEKRKWSQRLL